MAVVLVTQKDSISSMNERFSFEVVTIMLKCKNLHEMFASKDISTAGGGDKDVASVDAVLNCCDLEHFNFNGEPYYAAIVKW